METYLLKSVACLAILLLFYKLLLEKENMHNFKRFYLLGSVIIAMLIPFITFTTYVEAAPASPTMVHENANLTGLGDLLGFATEKNINHLPFILWTVYGIGVLFFGFRFLKNLQPLILKIKQNPKLKKNSVIYVLLREETAPHTFWNYIFLNKEKFETHAIPKEVFQHEEAHAKQKHSFDILFMELLQIIFWFNPLIYFTKNAIKLNHEFLADQAVLEKNTATATYQETLLSYSSNQSNIKLVNPINYSSLKKRFSVMKTKTSKTAIWARSFVLLPLLTILIYSFSSKETVKKEITDSKIKNETILPDVSTITSLQEKATPEMVSEYNKLAKFYNSQPKDHTVVRVKDFRRMEYIFKLMTPEQKKNSEKFPDILLPPPPPPPAPPTPKKTGNPPLPPPPPIPEVPEAIDPATLPALPPPASEHIKNLAKEGANFYFEGKEISSKKAIELVESNKDLRIQITDSGSGKPIVQMFSE